MVQFVFYGVSMINRRRFRLTYPVLSALMVLGSLSLTHADPLIPLPSPSAGGRAVVELLTNRGFETDSNSDSIPDDWQASNTTVSKSDKRKCNSAEKPFAYTGECAFMFRGNADGTRSRLQQDISADDFDLFTSGTEITLSAYLDPRSGIVGSRFARLLIKFSDDTKFNLDLTLPSVPSTIRAVEDYALQTITQPLTIPNGATITSIRVRVEYNGTSGKFLVDDVRLSVNVDDGSEQVITDEGEANDSFGSAVALDGEWLAVGAPGRNIDNAENQGAVYLFHWDGSAWTPSATLTAADGTGILGFGEALALRGSTLAIGATNLNTLDTHDETVFIFTRSNTTWTQQAQLTADDGQLGDLFGIDLALAADGNTVVVGAPGVDTPTDSAIGAAYVFTRSGTTWTQSAKLTPNGGTGNDAYGTAVTLDGDTIAVGAPSQEGALPISGAVYIYTGGGATWTQQTKLSNLNPVGVGFGSSLALRNNTLLIGSPGDSTAQAISIGAAYVYTEFLNTWLPQGGLLASDGASGDGLGLSVALSGDGDIALVSALEALTQPLLRGSAYRFTRSGILWSQAAHYEPTDGEAGDNVGQALAVNEDWVIVGVPNDDVDGKNNQGSIRIYALP